MTIDDSKIVENVSDMKQASLYQKRKSKIIHYLYGFSFFLMIVPFFFLILGLASSASWLSMLAFGSFYLFPFGFIMFVIVGVTDALFVKE